ncbi:RNase H domain-containing protein [Caerostris extrusa]|uniref:RNase H domain-containing protein n=1 Tax=Caerostris extrusa TaxID=172846 RepID=A0AAV4RM21_CAEEX|nr:RNase H domain-containing protein [Caerostris extrusa]
MCQGALEDFEVIAVLFQKNRCNIIKIKLKKIKKDRPLGLIWKQGLADIEVKPSVPFNLLIPTTVLSNETFNEDLKVKFIKHEEHPELLRQLALEIINNISPRALVIYTDGSKSDSGRTGSGIFMKTSTGEFRYRFRNLDHSSIFRSELIAISEALSLALDFKVPDVWILIDIVRRSPALRPSAVDEKGRETAQRRRDRRHLEDVHDGDPSPSPERHHPPRHPGGELHPVAGGRNQDHRLWNLRPGERFGRKNPLFCRVALLDGAGGDRVRAAPTLHQVVRRVVPGGDGHRAGRDPTSTLRHPPRQGHVPDRQVRFS